MVADWLDVFARARRNEKKMQDWKKRIIKKK